MRRFNSAPSAPNLLLELARADRSVYPIKRPHGATATSQPRYTTVKASAQLLKKCELAHSSGRHAKRTLASHRHGWLPDSLLKGCS